MIICKITNKQRGLGFVEIPSGAGGNETIQGLRHKEVDPSLISFSSAKGRPVRKTAKVFLMAVKTEAGSSKWQVNLKSLVKLFLLGSISAAKQQRHVFLIF